MGGGFGAAFRGMLLAINSPHLEASRSSLGCVRLDHLERLGLGAGRKGSESWQGNQLFGLPPR